MIHHPAIAPIAIASLTTFTSLLGQLGGTTTITIGEAAAVFVFVSALVAWISRKLQKIEDNQERTKEEIQELKDHVASRSCPGGACYTAPKK